MKNSSAPPINKSIEKLMEKPMEQPKAIPDNSRLHDKIIPVPDYAIPQTRSEDDSKSVIDKRKTILDISREVPIYPDLVFRPPPKLINHLCQMFLEVYWILTQKLIWPARKIHHFKKVSSKNQEPRITEIG